MLKYLSGVILCWMLLSCKSGTVTTINIQIEGMNEGEQPLLIAGDQTYKPDFDTTGFAVFKVEELAGPTDAILQCGKYCAAVYMEPGKGLDIYMSVDSSSLSVDFSGEGARCNEVLNGKYQIPLKQPDYTLGENEFIRLLEEHVRKNDEILDTLGLGEVFTGFMKSRLRYNTFSLLGEYPVRHARLTGYYQPSEYYIGYIDSLLIEEDDLLRYPDYKKALAGWISVGSGADYAVDAWKSLSSRLDYIRKRVHRTGVREFLVDKYVMEYIKKEGIDSLGDAVSFYRSSVSDPGRKDAFEKLYGELQRIAPGQISPGFQYRGIDSTDVSLQELEGRFIYIGLWASWCKPSREELYHMKALEKNPRNKNICFVAISCDDDPETWANTVREMNPGCIQLYNGGDKAFMEAYRVSSLPHFILLDREGKIMNADMSRPSEAKTWALFKKLEKS